MLRCTRVEIEPNLHRYNRSKLIFGIHRPGTARWWIGNSANIRYQRLNVGLAERVSPRRHQRGLVESRTTVADDRREIGVTDFIESVSVGERMRLHLEIVVIGNALDGGFGIVAAPAVLIVEMAPERLLIA